MSTFLELSSLLLIMKDEEGVIRSPVDGQFKDCFYEPFVIAVFWFDVLHPNSADNRWDEKDKY